MDVLRATGSREAMLAKTALPIPNSLLLSVSKERFLSHTAVQLHIESSSAEGKMQGVEIPRVIGAPC